jgi:hypothetical protein
MNRKSALVLIVIALTSILIASCSPAVTPVLTDAVGSASIVDNATAFEKAISTTGTWIIAITKDLTIDKDLVLAGDFKNGKKDTSGNDLLQRKIALYTQDADRNITNRFTLTVRSLTVESALASIQHGTFKGDLYIAVDGFQLIDTKVEGNVYFRSEAFKASFLMDSTSSVTGVQEVKAS